MQGAIVEDKGRFRVMPYCEWRRPTSDHVRYKRQGSLFGPSQGLLVRDLVPYVSKVKVRLGQIHEI